MLSAGILLSRLLGYLREAVIAYQQGAGVETDAYNAAFLIPDLMNYFLAGGTLSITFIPLFSAYLARDDEAGGWRLFSTIATIMGGLLLAGVVVAEVFAGQLVGVFFPGFSGGAASLTTEMTRIVLPCQLFHYLGGLLLAVQMAHGRFRAATLAPLVYNASIIVFGLAFGPWMGMKGFAIGALVGAVLGPFGLSLFFIRDRIRFKVRLGWRDEGFRKYILLSLPLMLGVSLMTVDEWLGRIIGSGMMVGTISWLNYARRLMLVPIAVIGQAAGQAALPFLSRLASEGKREELGKLLTQTLHYVLLLAIVAAALTFVLAQPVVEVIYQRGAFSASDTARTAAILRFFAIGIVAWGVQLVSTRAFYAEQNTWLPMVISTAVTLIAVPVYLLLGEAWAAQGLAAAATLGMTGQALLTLTFYRRRNSNVSITKLLRSALQGVLLAAPGALVAYFTMMGCYRMGLGGGAGSLVVLAGSGGLGLLSSMLAAVFVAPEEWRALTVRIRRKVKQS